MQTLQPVINENLVFLLVHLSKINMGHDLGSALDEDILAEI